MSSLTDKQKHDSEVWKAIALNLRAEAKRAKDNAGLYPQARDEILQSARNLEDAASTAMFAADKLLPLHVPIPDASGAVLNQLREQLLDPAIVHTNMCRKIIAMPSPKLYFHALGDGMLEKWERFEAWEREQAKEPAKVKIQDPDAPEVLAAKAAYIKYAGNHPTIHCNLFPTWAELTEEERQRWILKTGKEAK